MAFLVYLASFLKENKSNPCEPPFGCLNFRNLVAEFMKSYYNIPLTSDVRLLSCVRLYQKFIGSTYLPLLSYASYDPPFFSGAPECCCIPFSCCCHRNFSSTVLTGACNCGWTSDQTLAEAMVNILSNWGTPRVWPMHAYAACECSATLLQATPSLYYLMVQCSSAFKKKNCSTGIMEKACLLGEENMMIQECWC